jgi:transcriptional antiterminator NusG
MIYVLHVRSGFECEIVSSLVMQDIKAYAPRHILLERHKGIWHRVQRAIFPGYVFVDIQLTDDIYYKIRNTDGVVRFLGFPPTPLPYSEQKRMQWIFDAGLIDVSHGFIRNGKLVITDGLLKGREDCIVNYSIRQKRCKLYCMINGKRHCFSLSAEPEKV